jgi:hypothetical protein
MTIDQLIQAGVCRDLVEVLDMFPIESIDDFRGRSTISGPAACQRGDLVQVQRSSERAIKESGYTLSLKCETND